MKNIFKILTISVALLTAIAIFTSCDQLIDDPKDFFEYWTSEVIPKGFSISGPQTTNSEGSLCVPSGAPVTVTINLHNPRKFKLVMPRNSTDAHNIIHFPGFTPTSQPAYGSTGDYTLTQTADDKLELTYKSSFLKKYEWSSKNIGPEITFISTDGRKFSKKFSLNLKVDTPPKLSSMVTIGKTTQDGKDYYVIILKAEDMTETAGTPSGLLHKEIKMLSVTPGTGDSTSLNIAFTGTSGFPTGDRLLAAGAVNSLGSGEGPGTISSLISDTWALRYRTDTEVKAASKTYTFTLIDEKGLKSSPITVPTPLLKAEDVQLSYGTPPNTIPASINPPPNPYTINAGLSDTEVTVTAKTATSGAKITGKVEKQDGRSWVLVNNSIDSGSWDEVNILLPAPEYDQEVLYKISLTAGGDGFDAGTEKTFFVKVTKNTTITIDGSELNAWEALKTAVENSSPGAPSVIIINGTIKAPSVAEIITVNRAVTIQGSDKASDKLDADNWIRIFHVWTKGNLKLEKLTLLNGKSGNIYPGGGAIYCTGGKLTTEDVIIENCNAKNGGAIYAKDAESGYESTPSVITLKNTQIKSCAATGTGPEEGRGGAICCIKSSLTLNNTTIGGSVPADGNTARRGGGIYFAFEEGMLDVSAGNFISYNKATNTSGATVGGGGVYVQSGTFTLGGTVSHNEASDSTAWLAGGGVYVGPKAKFIMKAGATISGNLAAGGGGVYIHADRYAAAGSFTMEGGTILGCHAGGPGFTNAQGGGVYIKADGSKKGSFTMKGGTIDGCTVTVKSDKIATGGGVYVEAGAVFKMSGGAVITLSSESNTLTKSFNDVYLDHTGTTDWAFITVTDALTSTPAAARLTMKYVYAASGSGYYVNRNVVKGYHNGESVVYTLKDTDVSKFKVTPEPPTWQHPGVTWNWRLEHSDSGSGEGIGKLTYP